VRLLVSVGDAAPVHTRFAALGEFLAAGDLVVVNTSATVPAAVDGRLPDGDPIVLHFSGEMPGGEVLVEVRQPVAGTTAPRFVDAPVDVDLLGAGRVRLHAPFAGSRRLWLASADLAGAPDLPTFLAGHGRPIRYRHVPRDWPIEAYQTVFAREPGSAEMPSASRPFSPSALTRLVSAGVLIAPLTLHCGVSSLEGDEDPYPEPYDVPPATAELVNHVRARGNRVIAGGTTVVRALETVAAPDGRVTAGAGWTSHVVTPETGVRAVDGLLTGLHEPRSSHLRMLAAFAGPSLLSRCYRAAVDAGYLWHEFGDVHLLLP
jgi:S-adenosylmethionine:tRNA ribosyltransferase-isomerase